MTRIAHCCCGSLRAEATGEPALIGACHCMECQRRTGSPFGVSTFFAKEQVRNAAPTPSHRHKPGERSPDDSSKPREAAPRRREGDDDLWIAQSGSRCRPASETFSDPMASEHCYGDRLRWTIRVWTLTYG